MHPPTDDLRAALRQRAESDRLLGAADWPIKLSPPYKGGAGRVIPAPTAPRPIQLSELGTQHSALRTQDSRAATLLHLDTTQVRGCTKCGLARTRTQTVFGQGNPHARIVFVGEAPGFEEDRSGQAFVGRAGQLLTDMIEKGMRLKRDEVFICNVLKCRPPENRTPAPDEIVACSPYLFEQLRTIRPEVIVALGAPAAQTLLNSRDAIGRLRGRFHDFSLPGDVLTGTPPIPLMPTYHPAYLLRSPGEKGKSWEDLKKVLTRLGLPIPGSK